MVTGGLFLLGLLIGFVAGFFVGGHNAKTAELLRKEAERIALERLEELKKKTG